MNTLVALLCICIGQGGEPKPVINNVHPSIGALGAARNDNSYFPGDIVHVTFDVSGLKLDTEGRYRVAAKLVVKDAAGKTVASEDYGVIPPRLGILAGGKTRFAFHHLIPVDQAAGTYKAKLQLTDAVSKQETAVEQQFKVSPPGFGLIRFQAGRGPFGQAETTCTGSVGEVLYLRVVAVGLSKGKEGQASLDVAMEVQDALGKPIGKPQTMLFPTIDANEPVTLQFELPLDQAGKYKVQLKAIDKPSGRNAALTIPVTVVE